MKYAMDYPDSGLLNIHYTRNTLLGADGLAHIRHQEGEPCTSKTTHYMTERQKAEIQQCLHCTKEKCRGGGECFPVHKKKERKNDD